jgi:hypothetical protein
VHLRMGVGARTPRLGEGDPKGLSPESAALSETGFPHPEKRFGAEPTAFPALPTVVAFLPLAP